MLTLAQRAKAFAIEAHKDQKYGELDYSFHLEGVVVNVLERNRDNPMLQTLIAIAWLHDVVEDTDVAVQQLEREFGLCIALAVRDLSKTKGQDYKEYMLQCCKGALAREVKICDTMFNLQQSFLNNREKGMKKYPEQLAILVAGHWDNELLFYKEEECQA